jgi:aryl-alcohol dehydrogenase-like predicted oxidoreductase
VHRLEENLSAVNVELSANDLREIEQATSTIAVQGQRYTEASQRMIDR